MELHHTNCQYGFQIDRLLLGAEARRSERILGRAVGQNTAIRNH